MKTIEERLIREEGQILEEGLPLARAAIAGFTGGYVMTVAGYWIQAVLGIGQLDLAHAGLRYVAGGKAGWWVVGIIFHLIDSVLLGLFYARVFYPAVSRFTRPLGRMWSSVASGVAFGVALWLFLAMLIAMPFMGAGVFARKTGSVRPALTDFAVHVLFGLLLGLIYGEGKR